MRRSLSSIGIVVLTALLLAACYPEYNWREVSVAEGRAQALFPARVHTQARQFEWEGGTRAFTLSSATVGKAVYASGHMLLSADELRDPAVLRQWQERLVQSLYANYQAAVPAVLPGPGQDILIESQRAGEPVRLVGRVQVIGDALVEIVAAGPKEALPMDRAREFVASLKPAG